MGFNCTVQIQAIHTNPKKGYNCKYFQQRGGSGREGMESGGGGEIKAEKPSVGGVWVISGTIQLQLKYHLLGSSNQS